MNVIIINLILLIFFSFLIPRKNKILKHIYLGVITFQFIFFYGLRHVSVGTDTYTYLRIFNNIVNGVGNDEIEVGYSILLKIISIFTNNFTIVLIIHGALIYIGLSVFLKRYSSNYFLAFLFWILLGFFPASMNLMRQYIAMTITLFTFHYAYNKQFGKYIISCLLAISIHSTAIVTLPLYFIVNFNLKRKHFAFISVIYMFFLVFRNSIANFLTLFYYGSSSEVFESYETTSGIGGLTIFIIGLVILGYFLLKPFESTTQKFYKVIFNILIIAAFIQTMSSYSYLFTRLGMYYFMFATIYIPVLFSKGKSLFKNPKVSWLLKKVILIFIVVLYTFSVVRGTEESYDTTQYHSTIPYHFYWEN